MRPPRPSTINRQRSLNQCRHVLRYRELLKDLVERGSLVAKSLHLQVRYLNQRTMSNFDNGSLVDFAYDMHEVDIPLPLDEEVKLPRSLLGSIDEAIEALTMRHLLGILPPVTGTLHRGWATDALLDTLRVGYEAESLGLYSPDVFFASQFVTTRVARNGPYPVADAPPGTTRIVLVVCIDEHWVHICLDVRDDKGYIEIQNSILTSTRVQSVARQLARGISLNPAMGWLNVTWEEPEMSIACLQANSSDCGFFALEFALYSCMNRRFEGDLDGITLRLRASRMIQSWHLSSRYAVEGSESGHSYSISASNRYPLQSDTAYGWLSEKFKDSCFDE
ncbi:hypothetical protein AC578_4692 [Pseudocercospora eumusae]|uniref:Ubiquitin-like protease family profile domain-containing protein n=1 Tax=Pseudocercospora eumusae TaxID=321146 RepID=A0A139H7G0_9PEZI|nr:hypothetical protein AC578_4692 [Pseudocercospora eumusae]